MILKYFRQKKLTVFAETTASFCKNLIRTLDFEKNANFFAENWQKSQKFVTITSTPDEFVKNSIAFDLYFADGIGLGLG
jgi:hypothetical protein